MNSVVTKEILITEEVATNFLSKNDPRQRPMNVGWASMLARDISHGKWTDALAEPIDFSTEGYMMNGQHRCKAVLMSHTPIMSIVRFNCPTEWFYGYDRNKSRTVGDYYKATNSNIISGIATFAVCIENKATLRSAVMGRIATETISKKRGAVMPTVSEKLDYIYENETELTKYASIGRRMWTSVHGGSGVCYGSGFWLLKRLGADDFVIDEIVEDFIKTSPSNHNVASIKDWLYKTISACARNHTTMNRQITFSIPLALYEAYFEKAEIKQIKGYIDKCWNKYYSIIDERR